MISKANMHPWFVWIYWINPLAYGFQALLANEFHNTIIPCVGPNLVPNGATYLETAYQSCAGVPGAIQGATFVTGIFGGTLVSFVLGGFSLLQSQSFPQPVGSPRLRIRAFSCFQEN
jgi:hypothetical protein